MPRLVRVQGADAVAAVKVARTWCKPVAKQGAEQMARAGRRCLTSGSGLSRCGVQRPWRDCAKGGRGQRLRSVEWLQVGAGVPAGAAGYGCGGCVPGAGGRCAAGRRSGAGAGGAARVLRRRGRYEPDQLARAGAVTCPGCRGVRPLAGSRRLWGARVGRCPGLDMLWLQNSSFEKSNCFMKKFI